MSTMTLAAAQRRSTVRLATFAAPATLFGVALLVRFLASMLVRFPLTEGSAYYVDVARNLATGRGLVIDSMWSYATPPLVLPRPAFELWQPLASFVAAAPMAVVGPSFGAAQLAFGVLGALLAPLAWLVARETATRHGLDAERVGSVAFATGLLVALGGPFVLATAVPDSTLPFSVLIVAACLVLPAAAEGRSRAIVALGILAGLAYLTRMEAVYLGIAFIVVGWRAGVPWLPLARRAAGMALIVAAVASPWWLRNLAVFGTPLPGQVVDNLLLTANAQIYAYNDPPTLEAFLAQGAPTLVGNVLAGTWHNLVNVLLVPGAAFSVVGAVGVVALLRRRRESVTGRSPSALFALAIAGLTTFAATSFLFPVATLWGTFEHAAGPLFVVLAVMAALALDAFVARVRSWRDWPRSNAWLAPAALAVLAASLTAVQLTSAASQAAARERQIEQVAAAVEASDGDAASPVISDHPVWLAAALGRPALALPDEPAAAVLALANRFAAQSVVVVDGRGQHPAALRAAAECFVERPLAAAPPEAPNLAVFDIPEACR